MDHFNFQKGLNHRFLSEREGYLRERVRWYVGWRVEGEEEVEGGG